jgi:hypothetical protein
VGALRVHQITSPQPKAGGFLFGVSQSIGSAPVRANANAFGTRSNATQPAGLFPQSGKNQSLRVHHVYWAVAILATAHCPIQLILPHCGQQNAKLI